MVVIADTRRTFEGVDIREDSGVRAKTKLQSASRSYPLQYLRAGAALSVLVFHASFYTNSWQKYPLFLDVFGNQLGLFGVLLFFAISGAMMAGAAKNGNSVQFLTHRILRIYPIYIIVASCFLSLVPVIKTGVSFDAWAFGLIPGGRHVYGLGVEWTLPYEITFYILIFFMMLAGAARFATWVGLAWCTLIIAVHFTAPELQIKQQYPSIVAIPIAIPTLAFAAGLVTPRLSRLPYVFIFGPLLGIGVLVLVQFYPSYRTWWFILASALFVSAALSAEASKLRPIPFLAKIGDWSFAIYLVHVQIIIAVLRFTPGHWSPPVLWSASIALALGIGCVVGVLDVKLYRKLRHWSDQVPPKLKAGAVAAFVSAYLTAGFVWMAI